MTYEGARIKAEWSMMPPKGRREGGKRAGSTLGSGGTGDGIDGSAGL